MNRYVRVDRGSGSRAGQLLQHEADPNRWQVRVFIGRKGNGKRQYHSEIVHGRKRQAEARLVELLQTKNTGKLTPRSRATLEDLAREWLSHKAHDVSARTLQGYRHAFDLYILPTLGKRRLGELTLREIDGLYTAMRAGTLPKTPRSASGWQGDPLSARTVQLAHNALNQALKQAVRWNMIPHNPAAEATVKGARSKPKRALSVAERTAFLNASSTAFHRVLFRTMIDTGMRPGEACALTWADLDFNKGRIRIERAITKDSDGQPMIAPPKTAKSVRTIHMFGLEDTLLAHYKWMVEHGLDATGHVFTNQEGRIVTPWNFNKRELERVAAAAGITDALTLYCFRHTFATLHLASGTPLKVVSEWLGHSTIQQTANTYMHVSNDVADDYAERHVAWLASAGNDSKGTAPN